MVPQSWKCSNVTPVHKGGPCNDPGNFRPISVVLIAAKLLEKVVSNPFLKVMSYLVHAKELIVVVNLLNNFY